SVLFGWLTEEGRPETVFPAMHAGSRLSVGTARFLGGVRSNSLLYCFLVACLLVPGLWFTPQRKAALVVVIYLCTAWAPIVAMPNTGAILHHVILLWPFPHFLIALTGAQLSYSLGKYGGPAMIGALGLILSSNLAVINQYYADLTTRGTTVIWTDAIYPLAGY